jgi:uncharacterized membrane protein YfcA
MTFLGFTMEEVAAALGIALVGGLVRGFTGFGGSMILSPGLALIVDTPQAVAISIFLNVLVGIPLAPSAFPHVKWRMIAPMAVASMVMAPVGVVLLVGQDPDLMRRIIAVIVITFAIVLAMDWRYTGKPHPAANVGVGAMAGFLNGATGVGGPPVILYVLAGPGSAEEKRASIIWLYVLFTFITAIGLWYEGVLDGPTALIGLSAAPLYLGSAWLGMKFFGGSTDKIYHRVALCALFLIALAALLT